MIQKSIRELVKNRTADAEGVWRRSLSNPTTDEKIRILNSEVGGSGNLKAVALTKRSTRNVTSH